MKKVNSVVSKKVSFIVLRFYVICLYENFVQKFVTNVSHKTFVQTFCTKSHLISQANTETSTVSNERTKSKSGSLTTKSSKHKKSSTTVREKKKNKVRMHIFYQLLHTLS